MCFWCVHNLFSTGDYQLALHVKYFGVPKYNGMIIILSSVKFLYQNKNLSWRVMNRCRFLNILAMYPLNYILHSIAPKILANQQWIGTKLSCYSLIRHKLIHACFFFHGYRSASYESGAWNCRPHQWSFWNADNSSNPSPGMCLFAFLWTSLDARLLVTWNLAFWMIV